VAEIPGHGKTEFIIALNEIPLNDKISLIVVEVLLSKGCIY
jgi:hypothetical protein